MFLIKSLHHLLSVILISWHIILKLCMHLKILEYHYVSTMLQYMYIVLYLMESSEFIWQIFVGYIF